MALNTKAINRRIKSIVNTKKITKAMELVAASKMRKAVASVLATRPYAAMAWSLVGRLESRDEAPHPLLRPRTRVSRSLAVLLASDRGLCGGFNAQIQRKALEFAAARPPGSVDFIAIGRRGEQFLRRRGLPVAASFGGSMIQAPSVVAVRPLARLAREGFVSGAYDEVVVLYTDFVSAVLQKPRAKTLLPLQRDSELGLVGERGAGSGEPLPETRSLPPREFLFEPSPAQVLDALLPRIFEAQLYQAILESLASEHSARMMAMRSASDSAGEMIDDLRFTFNQARQASITQEIAEISAGTAALTK